MNITLPDGTEVSIDDLEYRQVITPKAYRKRGPFVPKACDCNKCQPANEQPPKEG